MQLEKSAQNLANGSADFFEVTVDGRNHTIASSGNGLTYDSALKCPNGSVRMDVFCGKYFLWLYLHQVYYSCYHVRNAGEI